MPHSHLQQFAQVQVANGALIHGVVEALNNYIKTRMDDSNQHISNNSSHLLNAKFITSFELLAL